MDLYRTIEWFVSSYKSLMQGIGEGFYDDPKYLQNDECLNKEAMDLIFNLLEVYNHSDSYLDAFFKLGTGLITLQVAVQANCNTHAFFYDSISFCFFSRECASTDQFIINVLKHILEICTSFA